MPGQNFVPDLHAAALIRKDQVEYTRFSLVVFHGLILLVAASGSDLPGVAGLPALLLPFRANFLSYSGEKDNCDTPEVSVKIMCWNFAASCSTRFLNLCPKAFDQLAINDPNLSRH